MEAETILVGGAIFSAGMRTSRPGGVAVSEGRIVAVGDDADLAGLRGPRTEVVDLRGGLLLPGFQDAHVHPIMGGVTMLACDLHGATSAEDALRLVGEYATANPDVPWIVGAGWSMEHFAGGTPTRQQLDRAVPDRPAYLTNRDGHGAWVNTAALDRAAITAGTPDPADGRIERDEDGSPAGTLHEGAVELVARLKPPVTAADQTAGLLAAQDHLLALGITAWQDAAVGEALGQADLLPIYLAAARSGTLLARVRGALWWDRARSSGQIGDLVERRAGGQVGRFAPTTVKIMLDGVAENHTASMLEPYLDGCGCSTGNNGLRFVDPVGLREYVTRLDAEGFQVHFHALGDRAVRDALDALAVARAVNGPSRARHHLAHLQVVHPHDIARFAELDATANIQALWAAHEPQMDELTIPFLGEQRAQLQYPFADIAAAGGALAAGSDWSVSSANPLDGIHVAVNRVAPDAEPGTPPLASRNALDLATAMTAYTAGSARVNGLDARTGRLAEGLLADLCVLDRDPFDGPSDQIATARVASTWIDGRRVFSAGD